MAATPQPTFTIDGSKTTAFGTASSAIALPGSQVGGTDTTVRIVNMGPNAVAFAMGTGGSITAVLNTDPIVMPGDTAFFTIPASADHIAGICAYGPAPSSTVNITTGF